ncbi:hypothetical protein PVAND_007488 [Polypedilum vanderplanki]|uniref:DNA repair protein complementing XP-C cells-like protein n=1 Tax=Polypedilum vanderplanki TaxID=319348 RepID=A0A9J6C744_POLVA|nr:hypothetical protein PVAND_007488 [Polypedilum vanderplanki]
MRPKREAARKSQLRLKEKKIDLQLSEDEEENIDSEDDFSDGSSDDYKPNESADKDEESAHESEEEPMSEDEDDSADEEDEQDSFATNIKEINKKKGSKVASLKKDAINKFKRKQSSLHKNNLSLKLKDVLKKAEYTRGKQKSLFSQSDDDNEREKSPIFDCSGGVNLSDSSSESDDDGSQKIQKKDSTKNKPNLLNSINESSDTEEVDLNSIHIKLKEIENAKEKLSNYKHPKKIITSTQSQKENIDIADLLAMGENETSVKRTKSNDSQKRAKPTQGDDSDSDNWEDVEENDSSSKQTPKESVEIVLDEFGDIQKKKLEKLVDVEAQLKRKFNKRRKEMQEYLHKTELICWISHYSFVNKRLNDMNLINSALKMLPENSKQCYPKEKTDIDYFKQITKWYKSIMTLKNTKMYCEKLKKRPPLMMSLAIQMKFKAAICRRDYVLIYIVLLRALGIQCRMVQSAVCDPKICPKSELMSLSKNDSKKTEKNAKKTNNKSKTTKKSNKSSKSQKSAKSMKIPQLDGADDLLDRKKTKKQMKLKGASEYKVDESFVSVSKESLKSNAGNLSPKIKIEINPPNSINTKASSSKVSQNGPTKSTSKLNIFSPRKTRSRDTRVETSVKKTITLPQATQKSKNSGLIKKEEKNEKTTKETLKLLSPRRTRSISNSPSTTIRSNAKESNLKDKKKSENITTSISHRLENRSRSPCTSAEVQKLDAQKLKQNVKTDALKVNTPISRRLRSKSTDNNPNLSANDSRKRTSTVKDEIENKRMRMNSNAKKKPAEVIKSDEKSKKRNAPSEEKDDVASKKKKLYENNFLQNFFGEPESDSDESLKYFKSTTKKGSKAEKSVKNEHPSTSSKVDTAPRTTSTKIDRRILSSDDEENLNVAADQSGSSAKKSKGIDIWVEVYSEKDEKWIAIDVFQNKIDCVKDIMAKATHPLVYVFAWNNDNSLKDVTARYCPNLNTTVRKMRVDRDYLNKILIMYPGTKTARDLKEDDELNKLQLAQPMPTSIAEFKNHPLYALKRHLLKYEAIYPPEPPILGYIRDEPIYPRDCVFVCRSRETWLKEARVVKLYEEPYKIVKTMKWNKPTNKLMKDVPLELFGIWQTKDYEPPTAENGIVPRNGYGNVELFKPQMLPYGTVHLQLPGLQKVCKKLGVDCAQAVVGFDSSGGWPYPVYDGFVICKEFEEKVVDAWNREQEEIERKEREKIEKRVYGNWKKLIKGLLIRERLKLKYNFDNNLDD